MALTIDEAINPIKVTGDTAVLQAVSTYRGRVKMIIWSRATTDAHKLEVGNKEGSTIWKPMMNTNILGNDIGITFPGEGLMVNGLSISDMDSGEVYIYLEDRKEG